MATVYSIQKTKVRSVPSQNLETNEMHGRVRVAYGEYECAGAQDTINMFDLPDGARILRMELSHDALGTSTTASVGYAAYSNADGTAVAAAAAAFKAAASTAAASAVPVPTAASIALLRNMSVDADGSGFGVTVTTAGANATGTVVLVCEYVVD